MTDRLLAATLDLRGCDRRVVVGLDAGHASTNDAAADEAHHRDDVALLGKFLGAVFVELVDRTRGVLPGERHAESNSRFHKSTMAGVR